MFSCNLLKYETCNRIWLKAKQLVQLNYENRSQLYTICTVQYLSVQYAIAKPQLYSDIRSRCHQSVHAVTFRYDSTLLGHTFLHQRCFCIRYMIIQRKEYRQLICSYHAHPHKYIDCNRRFCQVVQLASYSYMV